jgi:hypothetical protein
MPDGESPQTRWRFTVLPDSAAASVYRTVGALS